MTPLTGVKAPRTTAPRLSSALPRPTSTGSSLDRPSHGTTEHRPSEPGFHRHAGPCRRTKRIAGAGQQSLARWRERTLEGVRGLAGGRATGHHVLAAAGRRAGAGHPGGRVPRLGRAPGRLAGQDGRTRAVRRRTMAAGLAGHGAPGRRRRLLAAGQALPRPRVARPALQDGRRALLAAAGMVAVRHHRRAGNDAPSRADGELRRTAMARSGGTLEFRLGQPGRAAAHGAGSWN